MPGLTSICVDIDRLANCTAGSQPKEKPSARAHEAGTVVDRSTRIGVDLTRTRCVARPPSLPAHGIA